MTLTKNQIKNIEFWIKNKFYYVEYPDPAQEYWWKDREGKWKFMDEMGLDHLKASAKLIERDINNFISSRPKKDSNMPVYEKHLIEPAKKKKLELEEVLRKKVLE